MRFTNVRAGGVFFAVAALVWLSVRPLHAVRITEIMYHPAGSEAAGDPNLEFIEITNEQTTPLDLLGYHFCGAIRYVFTEHTFLKPGEYLVIAADPEAIKQVYGIENVVGPWGEENGGGEASGAALSNGGERIRLCDTASVTRATVEYNDRGKWPGGADGTGHSLEIEYVFGAQDDADNWNLSGVMGGSPGAANDTETGKLPVVFNEIYSIVPEGEARWVELYNKGETEIDLSGYHLSTDRGDLRAVTLPAGTKIAARGYLVFEADLNLDLSVVEADERVFTILTNPAGDRVIEARNFRPAAAGFSEARIPDGSKTFSERAIPTRGATNRVEVVTDVVINEVHFHPIDRDDDKEFIELYNRGDTAVSLSGWSFTQGVDFAFPDVTIAPGDYLVVARNPARVREIYSLSAAQVIGPETDDAIEDFGRLANAGERITLLDPIGNIADTVAYRDGGEWPSWADGGGSSMELIDAFQENGNPQAWDASDDSDRAPVTEVAYTGTANAGESELHLMLSGPGITVIDDLKMSTRITRVEADQTLVALDSTWRYFKGTEAPPADWAEPGFDDRSWLSGQAVIGFGEDDETTIIDDMRGIYLAIFFRQSFEVPSLDALNDPEGLRRLIFSIDYDDGYVVYVNGTRVLVTNMRDEENPTWESRAQASRREEKTLEDNDVAGWKELLRPGTNTIAISVHNATTNSNDFRFQARLVTGQFVNEDGPNLLTDGSFDEDSDLRANWTIEGTHVHSGRTTDNAITGGGSLKVISTGNPDNKVNRIETSNRGLPTLQRGASYLVTYKARWVVGAAAFLTRGKDEGTTPPSYANSARLTLPDYFGTPGAMNSVTRRQVARTGSSNVGPVIDAVRHAPGVPEGDVPVTVEARVADSDGVASVTLHYSIDRPAAEGDAGLSAVPMADPDGDGVYIAEIPGQGLNTIMVYYITATDTKDQVGRFPVDFLSRTHPPRRDPGEPDLNDHRYAVYMHDRPYAGSRQSYRVFMHKGMEQILSARALHSNDLVDSTFIFGDRDVYYNAGVRFSGSPWARQAWNESWRVRMPRDKPLHGELKKFGMEDHQGSGAVDGRERLSHYMIRFNQGGTRVPYSTQWLVDFQVNTRLRAQPREHYYMPSREFLEVWYPEDDDGYFYEMDDRHTFSDGGTRSGSNDGRLLYPPYGSADLGPDKEQYRYYFMPRSADAFDNWDEFIEFARVMTPGQLTDEEYDQRIWEIADVEEILRVMAIRLNTDDWDCWGANRGKNCYWYQPPKHGKWVILAWDMELTYGDVNAFAPPRLTATSNPNYNMSFFTEATRFINRPRIKRMYYGIMKEMMDYQFNSGFLTPYMDAMQSVGYQSTQHGRRNGFVDRRKSLLEGRVNSVTNASVEFAITTNGGQPITTDTPVVTIQGTAPVEVFSIGVVVDGDTETASTASFSNTGLLEWSAMVALGEGTHTVEFIAFDSLQSPLATAGIEVTVGEPTERFVRGDVDLGGDVNVTDAVNTLFHLFSGKELSCEDAADFNDDGEVNLADAVATLEYLFGRGAPPASTFPQPGSDRTADDVSCVEGLAL